MRKQFPLAHLPCALVLALVAMATPLPVAIGAGTPPSRLASPQAGTLAGVLAGCDGVPAEAFEDSPGYETWKVVEAVVAKDGETARIRLRHPGNDRVIAILQYRLVSSTVTEER